MGAYSLSYVTIYGLEFPILTYP